MADDAQEPNPIFEPEPVEPVEAVTPETPAETPAEVQGRDPKTGHFTTKHPAYLREAAADFGFSEEDIAGYSTDQLGAVVVRMQRRLAKEQQDLSRIAGETARRPAPAPEPAPKPEDDLLDLGTDEAGKPYTEADVSGPLLRVLKKQADELKKLRGTAGKIDELAQREQARSLNTSRALLDEAFEALGEGDHPLLGKGGISELGADSAEGKRRNAIVREAQIDLNNDTPRQIAKKIKAARDVLYPAAPAAPAGDGYEIEGVKPKPANGKPKPRISPEEFAASAVAKPTQRKANDLPLGEERAIAAIRAKYETNESSNDEDLNGLPD